MANLDVQKFVKIPREIDAPPQILWFEVDELGAFFGCFFFGILTRELLPFLALGVLALWGAMRLKRGRSEGVIFHILWWYGVSFFGPKRGPQPGMSMFIE